jgi:hypothetical protein
LNELELIQGLVNKVKSLNEAIMFEDDFEDQYADVEPGMEQGAEENIPQDVPQADIEGAAQGQSMEKIDPEKEGMKELDDMGEIDRIREITLSGMHKLCKNPQDPKYQALKKIFQMCDKGVEEEMKNQQQVQ